MAVQHAGAISRLSRNATVTPRFLVFSATYLIRWPATFLQLDPLLHIFHLKQTTVKLEDNLTHNLQQQERKQHQQAGKRKHNCTRLANTKRGK